VGVYRKQVPISLGVLDVDEDNHMIGFREKPVLSVTCSMGIYAFDPAMLRLIPGQGSFGFDDLMATCLARRIPVRTYPFDGVWLDIGRKEDYAAATEVLTRHRPRLVPAVRRRPEICKAA
jgi:NDP-sugar pyrophosphorylase family protein